MNKIITISREYGAGGHSIGKRVAEELGIPFYDRDILKETVKASGFDSDLVETEQEDVSRTESFFKSLCNVSSLYYNDTQTAIHDVQQAVILHFAQEGPCVILGRCGDYVLRERPNVLRTFVYAPLETRIQFAKSRPDAKDMPDRLWETQLAKHDRARASYYNYYTENRWGEAKNYDLCLNATLGREACADLIVAAARAMQEADK